MTLPGGYPSGGNGPVQQAIHLYRCRYGTSAADRGFRAFHISAVFQAPLRFAFEGCTDYSSDDVKIAGEDKMFGLQRRIIERTYRNVIFENLYDHRAEWARERPP
ncbi:MAG: hypothetical protein WCB18_00925 [Thermoplasmata archaeon]